jgi:hypothetical protein
MYNVLTYFTCYHLSSADIEYCIFYRFEIYCGNKTRGAGSVPVLPNNVSGAAAVYRNLKVVFDDAHQCLDHAKKRFVICDREYSSYTLVRTLIDDGFYFIGTCMPSRLGFPSEIVWPKNTRHQLRGQYNVSIDQEDNRISATAWRDSSNVYFLSSGASTEATTVTRRSKVSDAGIHHVPSAYTCLFLFFCISLRLVQSRILFRVQV